jgi:hypothetical protein
MPATRSLGRGRWLLLEDWEFILNGKLITIPKGFVTDLYSIPWPWCWFFNPDQTDNRPALIHDWLFATCGLRPTATDESVFNLTQVNTALRFAMEVCNLPWISKKAIYRGVDVGSWVIWGRYLRAGYSQQNPKLT